MHLDAYVANLVPFDASNESIALINPTVPIDISSSISLLGIWYFFTMCATNLRFLSISMPLAF